jgi:hypothetical protein
MISFAQSKIQAAFELILDPWRGIMDLDHVDNAIVENYRKLRTRIGVIALAFPVVLIAVGYYWGLSIQPTLSDYYYATDLSAKGSTPSPSDCGSAASCLSLVFFCTNIRAFPKTRIAGSVLRVYSPSALPCFPCLALARAIMTGCSHGPAGRSRCMESAPCWHLRALPSLLSGMSDSTLSELKTANPAAYKWFKRAYFIIAAYMVVSIGISIFLHYSHHGMGAYILLAEWSGIWAFAGYWFVKNWELTEVAKVLKARNAPMQQKTEADLADKL